jgi:hypothetical protein
MGDSTRASEAKQSKALSQLLSQLANHFWVHMCMEHALLQFIAGKCASYYLFLRVCDQLERYVK